MSIAEIRVARPVAGCESFHAVVAQLLKVDVAEMGHVGFGAGSEEHLSLPCVGEEENGVKLKTENGENPMDV